MPAAIFKDLSDGSLFSLNNIQYTKITPQKVSCCTSINASSVMEPNKKIMIKPLTEVIIDE